MSYRRQKTDIQKCNVCIFDVDIRADAGTLWMVADVIMRYFTHLFGEQSSTNVKMLLRRENKKTELNSLLRKQERLTEF